MHFRCRAAVWLICLFHVVSQDITEEILKMLFVCCITEFCVCLFVIRILFTGVTSRFFLEACSIAAKTFLGNKNALAKSTFVDHAKQGQGRGG